MSALKSENSATAPAFKLISRLWKHRNGKYNEPLHLRISYTFAKNFINCAENVSNSTPTAIVIHKSVSKRSIQHKIKPKTNVLYAAL